MKGNFKKVISLPLRKIVEIAVLIVNNFLSKQFPVLF